RSMESIIRVIEPYASGSSRNLDEVVSSKPEDANPETMKTEMAAASSRPHRIAVPEKRSLPRWSGLFAILLVGVGAAAFVIGSRERATPRAADVAPRPTAVTDLPDPQTSNAEALATYRSAMQAWRDGVGDVEARFRRAVQLDPNLGAAHLRIAYLTF